MITQKRLKELVHYNPNTGIFTWKVEVFGSHPKEVGDEVGHITKQGYSGAYLDKKPYLLHRVAHFYMTGKWPLYTDHINHRKLDNRWINLREVTPQENNRNQSINNRNTSGVPGVTWHKRDKYWKAEIKIDRKKLYLGGSVDKFIAICVRKSAENKYGFHLNHGKGEVSG